MKEDLGSGSFFYLSLRKDAVIDSFRERIGEERLFHLVMDAIKSEITITIK